MCDFEVDEPISGSTELHRRARKEHQCGSCRGRIRPGETYLRYSWFGDGTAAAVSVCEPCELGWQFFRSEHGSYPTPDWFKEALFSCFDGADKTDPEAKVWRDVYAGMLKRSRAAQRAEVRA